MQSKDKRGYARSRAMGVTMLEILVAIAILAILLGIGVPSFRETFAEARATTRANDLARALAMARSEAIRRNIRVTLCKTADLAANPLACDANATWDQGWLLFVDNVHLAGNVVGVIDGADSLVRVFPAQGTGTLDGGVNYAGGISYLPSGVSRGIKAGGAAGVANGSFTICDGDKGRKLILNTTGRVRVETFVCP